MLLRHYVKCVIPAGLLPMARRVYLSARKLGRRGKALVSRPYGVYLHAADSPTFQMSLRGSMNQNCCELHVFVQYRMLCKLAGKVGKPLRGRILEVGACSHPGMALMLLLAGADKVWLNNIFPIRNRLPRSWAENALVLMRLTGAPTRALESVIEPLEDGYVRVRPNLIELPDPCPCEDLDFAAETFDVVFSNAVLEHVRDPVPVLRNLHGMMSKDGWFVHAIDLRDHSDFERPLAFLSLSESEFRAIDPYSNRYRSPDWLEGFRAAGFTADYVALSHPMPLSADKETDTYRIVLQEDIPPDASVASPAPWVTEAERAQMSPEFQAHGLEALSVTNLLIAGRKI